MRLLEYLFEHEMGIAAFAQCWYVKIHVLDGDVGRCLVEIGYLNVLTNIDVCYLLILQVYHFAGIFHQWRGIAAYKELRVVIA